MFENALKKTLIEYGAMCENWRLKLGEIKRNAGADWFTCKVYIYKPHAKKPCLLWELLINEARKVVDFGNSKHTTL